jgi:hypothetical protein
MLLIVGILYIETQRNARNEENEPVRASDEQGASGHSVVINLI